MRSRVTLGFRGIGGTPGVLSQMKGPFIGTARLHRAHPLSVELRCCKPEAFKGCVALKSASSMDQGPNLYVPEHVEKVLDMLQNGLTEHMSRERCRVVWLLLPSCYLIRVTEGSILITPTSKLQHSLYRGAYLDRNVRKP